jgi:hypothetical protein
LPSAFEVFYAVRVNNLQKKLSLIELIKDKSSIIPNSDLAGDFMLPDFSTADVYTIWIDCEELQNLQISEEELEKILKRIQENEAVIVGYDLQRDKTDQVLNGAHVYISKQKYANFDIQTAIKFDSGLGLLHVGRKKVKFDPDKRPFLFVSLLASDVGKVFSYQEIRDHFKKNNLKIGNTDIKQYARQVRDSLRNKKIPPDILFSNKGYGLKLDA